MYGNRPMWTRSVTKCPESALGKRIPALWTRSCVIKQVRGVKVRGNGCEAGRSVASLPTVTDNRSRLGALFVVAAMSLLAGCGAADPSASADDSLRPAAPPPSIAAVPAPVLPAAATARDLAGAQATAQYWFDALSYAQQSGDMKPILEVSARDCHGCTQQLQAIRSAYASGGSVSGGLYTVREMTDEEFSAAIPLLNVVFDREALSIVGLGGATMQTVPAVPFQSARVRLAYSKGQWRVAEITGLAPLGSTS